MKGEVKGGDWNGGVGWFMRKWGIGIIKRLRMRRKGKKKGRLKEEIIERVKKNELVIIEGENRRKLFKDIMIIVGWKKINGKKRWEKMVRIGGIECRKIGEWKRDNELSGMWKCDEESGDDGWRRRILIEKRKLWIKEKGGNEGK